jgi:hypothetical protein
VNRVTLLRAHQDLCSAIERLWLTVGELSLSANEDQPGDGDLAAAEYLAERVIEFQGRIAQARQHLAGLPPAVPEQGLVRGLPAMDALVRRTHAFYWRELRAYNAVAQLRAATRRRGGAWPAWWQGVEQSIERCEGPVADADEAVGSVWLELAERFAVKEVPESNTLRRSS